ncbi:alpha/beta hydrolase family protein [Rhodococcus oryzae]|uniref:alpha/beta hydrolase family protein n=1 Tax=Rhodococcus oryzae TaxID=2571143 RepID=UPI0037A5F69D
MASGSPSPRRRWLRRGVGGLAVLLVLVLIGGLALVAGNSYALREERVTISTAAGQLRGVLALPRDARGPVGLVVFVHGDGPVEATSEGFYRPIWEALAEAGYASLSMSKPGVGGSQGNWLEQSLHDRAVEAETMIDWALDRPEIDPGRIGLWGASQGGWVLPEVAVDRHEVSFVIAVSPAVNWLNQGRYNLLAELDATGAGEAERRAAIAESDAVRALLNRGAPYEAYLEASADNEPMDRDRWGFVLRNHTADATAALGELGRRDIPVLLVLGEDDRNVDVDDTQRAYERLLGDRLTTARFPGAAHTLARSGVEESELWGVLVGTFAPRQVFVPGYLDAQRDFLAGLP